MSFVYLFIVGLLEEVNCPNDEPNEEDAQRDRKGQDDRSVVDRHTSPGASIFIVSGAVETEVVSVLAVVVNRVVVRSVVQR